MALSKPKSVDFEKARQKARLAQGRAIARQRAKLADPVYQAAQRAKATALAERQREARLAQQQDPEYITAQRLKRETKQAAKREAHKTTQMVAPVRSTSHKKSSRGMKGRTPTADERRVMDKLGALPCQCCLRRGRFNPVISLHHVTGRTELGAHYRSLPLCMWHHDTPADAEALQQYPDLIPLHAKGSLGGRAAWKAEFGTELEMLLDVWSQIGLEDQIPQMLGSLAKAAANLGYFTHPNPVV
ncbi:Ref family recombination enhancement nuclease [Aeromonas salmonicida]|uniref:Ref family recombination enhancement nuclease n=1 Tax=Aeromonas salmonicida TaxID=645 RepID=UPI00232DF163|nr:Ref family recombination enhancement nuclease [Aeromonas salmonicida]WCH25149.1 Ref family recombination enhancement nuclease [Aeromonas salmonicida]